MIFPMLLSRRSSHQPWVYNGEAEISQLLRRYGIAYEYESRLYQFGYVIPGSDRWCEGGFCPDFYLPATATRPALNLEVTFADHGRPSMMREERQANLDRLSLKREKIRLTSAYFGVETILVTQRVFMDIRRNPAELKRLIRCATERHSYRQRQRGFDPLAA